MSMSLTDLEDAGDHVRTELFAFKRPKGPCVPQLSQVSQGSLNKYAKVESQRCRHGSCTDRACTYADLCDDHAVGVYGCEVRASQLPGAGQGLFAAVPFEKGDTIDLYEGKRIAHSSTGVLPYGFHVPEHCCIIDASSTQSSITRYINHHPTEANCSFRRFQPHENLTLVAVVTTRDIRKGEELLANYGSQYAKSFGVPQGAPQGAPQEAPQGDLLRSRTNNLLLTITENTHKLYLQCLLRFPSDDEVESAPRVTREELVESIEGQICILIKHYQGVTVDLSEFTLIPDIDSAIRFTEYLHDVYSLYLFKSPLRPDYIYAFTLLRLYGESEAKKRLLERVKEENEHKYLYECLDRFLSWTPSSVTPFPGKHNLLRVRYYGPLGTSGYATICRDIVAGIVGVNQYLDLSFVPLSIQNFNPTDDNTENRLLRSLCPAQKVDDLYSLGEPCDVVILHSVCDQWIPIIRRERKLKKDVLVVGVTVWETDAIPPQWIPHVRWVDRLTVPNVWNRDVFARDVPGIDVTYLPHPVVSRPTLLQGASLPDSLNFDRKDTYVFYSINEWSGRKGMELLVKAFVDEFTSSDRVVLFLKTHGSVSKEIGTQFIDASLRSKANPPSIIVDYGRWDNDAIEYLHSIGDCYVSLTRAEGQGLGACHAALRGKKIIMSNYGGQTDYLKGVSWVKCKEVPAYLCSPFDARHQRCLDQPCCRFFSYFLAAQQKWGDPDVQEAQRLMRAAADGALGGSRITARYLQTHFNSDTIGGKFVDFVMSSVFLKEGNRVLCPRAGLVNTYDVPAEKLLPLRHFVKAADLTFTAARPKILVIGAGFLGNFGDDAYVEMHQSQLSDKYEMSFCNTTTFLDEHGKMTSLADYREGVSKLAPFDHLVVGGGGIINSGELKSSIFKVYFPYCKQHSLPISFISVGFGYPSVEDETKRTLDEATWKAWSEILEYAESITVRSNADRATVTKMIISARHHRVSVCADACYGLPSVIPGPPIPQKKSLIIYSPTTTLSLSHPDVAYQIQQQLLQHPGSRVAMIAMDGMNGDGKLPNDFIRGEGERLRTMFPGSLVFNGRYFSGLMRDLFEEEHGACSFEVDDQSPERVLNLLRKAHVIVTGRYHGLVMARALGTPYYVGSSSLYKIQQEIADSLNPESWSDHYSQLQMSVDSFQRFGRLKDPSTWSEDDRNTCITDVVTNSTASVHFVQNWSNQQLYRVRQQIFLR